MPYKRKTGENKTWKQFFLEWKKGMENVTPLQQANITQWGLIISTIGVIWGIIFAIRIGYTWMAIILVGGLVVVSMQFLGNWQKKQILKRMEEAYQIADGNETSR